MNIKLIPSYKILLLQIFSIICFYKSSAQFTQIGSKYTTFGSAVSGQVIAISDDGNTLVSSGSECAYIFTFNGSGFVQVGDRIKPNDFTTTITGLLPSVSVSSDGKTVMMGLYTDNNFIGAAWIFTFNGTNFVQLGSKLVGTGGIGITNQGFSVALSEDGKTAISGGSRDNSYTGAAWIYKFNGTSFSQVGSKLVGSGALGASHQGTSSSLSANGNIAYVGGFLDNGGRGAVWVYSFNGVNYTQNNKLTSSVPSLTGLGRLGSISSSQNGGILVASGSNYKISSGHAVVFTLIGTNYSQLQVLSIGTGMVSSFTGTSASVSSDGKTIAIGGYSDNKSFGAIWTFTFNGVSFVQIGQKLLPTDYIGTGSLSGFEFGISVDISGDGKKMALISSAEKNGIGASWVYSFSGINYNKVTKLYAKSYTAPGSKFGSSASISEDGKIAIIGAPGDAFNYGIAYAYSFDGINYKQFSDPLINLDTVWFGGGKQGTNVKVSSDGSTVIVGAPVRNNYYTNNFGAVYAYTLSGTKFVPIGANFGTWFNSEYGSALAMSSNGKKIVVGAFGHNSFNGASFIYTFNGSSFVNMGGPISRLLGSGEGYSVAMSGDGNTYIAGAPFDSPNGAVYVYTFNGVNYVPFGPKLVGSNSLGSPFQGINVEISKDAKTIFIGSENDNGGAGAFWVFTFNGTNYVQAGNKYVATGLLGSNPLFGNPISCSNDSKTLLVGAYNDNNGIGCTIVYTFNGSNYVQTGNKLIGTGASGNAAQAATALSGDGKIAIISGSKDNGETGAFWVFTSPGMASSSLVSVTSAIISGSNIISISGGNTVISSSYLPANANQNTIPGWNTTLNGIATFSTITGLLTATNNGNGIVYLQSYYGSIISGLYTITITNNFISQTITGFASITGQVFGNPPITISGVSATSGLSVSYTVNGPAVNTGNVVSFTGAGTVTITATQVGNANYNAASPVVQIVNVAKANQSITGFNTVAGQVFGNPPITISGVSATSGLSVSYTVNGPAVNTGNIVSITGAGTVTITASQVGNANYNAASPVVQIVNVAKANQSITGFNTVAGQVFGNPPITISGVSATSGLSVSYTVNGPAVNTGNVVSFTGAGTVTVTATQVGNANYNAALPVVRIVNVAKATPILSFISATTIGIGVSALNAISNSTGAISYTLTGGTASATISGNSLTSSGAGSLNIQVNVAADVNYNAGSIAVLLTVAGKPSPTIVYNNMVKTYGDAPFVMTVSSTNSTGAITYSIASGIGANISPSGVVTITGAGSVLIQASQAGDVTYNPAIATATLTINKANPTLNITSPGSGIAGSVITVGVATNSTGSISGVVTNGTGFATLSGNLLSLSGVGVVTVTVNQLADANYNAGSTAQVVTILQGSQTITGFNTIAGQVFGTPPITISGVSATSGLSVSYTVNGPAVNTGNVISITGAGTVTVTATQVGNANYNAAPPVIRIFNVAKANQSITGFNTVAGQVFGNPPITISGVSATSGLSVSYTVNGPAVNAGNVVSFTGAGTVTITATQVGNANYNAALPVVQIVNVAKANQSITGFNTVAGQVFGNPPITISGVSATSGLSVSYTVNGPAVNTGNIVSITGAGTVTVTASQVGNANYNAALPVVRIVNVAKATPILSFISATTIGIGVSALNAISNSTGAISYTLTGGTASATISGNSLTSSGAGSLNIQVNVAADVNYNAGSIAVLLTVTSTPSPTIVYNNMVKTYGDAPFVMTVSSTNSTGAITYSIASGMGANISPSGVVTITGAGSVLIQASQAGDVTYNPAIATATLTINKANPTLNITSPGSGIAGSVITVGVATNSTGSISGVVTNGTGFATLSGNLLSLSGVGVVTVTVNQLADANYNAGSTAQVVTILQGISQTITGFNTIAGQVFGDPPITISGVSATSGLSVSYTVNGPAVSTGNVISITGAGTVTITATQVGNTNYNAASPVVQIVNVAKANQSITGFGPFSNMTLGGSNLVNLFASATSGLPVNYSITGPASISGNIITVTGLGIVSIIASQPGDANYLPAAELNTSFEVMSIDGISTIPGIMLDQTITGMNSISGFTLSGTNNTITLNAIASSGLTVFYTVSGPAMVNENVVTIYDVGTVGITALQNGNAIYNPAIPVNISFTVVSVAGLPTLDMLGITNEINNVLIYPNPNNGTITVDAEDYQLIKIYTLNGNLIAKHYLRGVSNIIHIGDVPTGVYIVEFYSTSKKPLFRKITKR